MSEATNKVKTDPRRKWVSMLKLRTLLPHSTNYICLLGAWIDVRATPRVMAVPDSVERKNGKHTV